MNEEKKFLDEAGLLTFLKQLNKSKISNVLDAVAIVEAAINNTSGPTKTADTIMRGSSNFLVLQTLLNYDANYIVDWLIDDFKFYWRYDNGYQNMPTRQPITWESFSGFFNRLYNISVLETTSVQAIYENTTGYTDPVSEVTETMKNQFVLGSSLQTFADILYQNQPPEAKITSIIKDVFGIN